MNKAILIGRLTRDPDVRTAQSGTKVARYTLAVDRPYKKDGDAQTADFISCVAFNKTADFAEMYLHQGMKIAVEGRIQTGSYTKQDGTKVYTTDVLVNNHEFVESKNAQSTQNAAAQASDPEIPATDDFMDIPDGLESELPFR